MIYTEEASFPYPVVSGNSTDYVDNNFNFDVKITSDNEYYDLQFGVLLGSEYLEDLIKTGEVEYIALIKTQDSSFYTVGRDRSIRVEKRKLSFKKSSKIQLILRAKNEVNFGDNYDLDPFFTDDGEDIIIGKNSIVGFSNVVIFEEDKKKPLDLFEKKVDKSIGSEIKIEVREENVALIFKDEKYQYGKTMEAKRLTYPYIYMGLQKLLMEMAVMDSKNDDNILEIDENSIARVSKPVYGKVVRLLLNKGISQVSFDEVDEIIAKISPNIINEYYRGVMGVSASEN